MNENARGRRIIACATLGCSNQRLLDDGVPVPDAGAFCVYCQQRAEQRIAENVHRLTGRYRGGVAVIDGRLVARTDH